MGKYLTWKNTRKTPKNITDVVSIGNGWINENFNLGVLRSIRRTENAVYFAFEIGGGKKRTRYEAWSSLNSGNGEENIEKLEEHHSYVVEGKNSKIKVQCKNSKSDNASSSNFRYKIFLGEVKILSKSAAPWSKNKFVTLATLRRDFESNSYGQFEMKNLKVMDGEMYRYWGCERCHSKISGSPNQWGKYSCNACKVKGELKGRICTMARNVEIGDGTPGQNGKLFGVVIFHDVIESIVGKQILEEMCSAFSDVEAKQGFQKMIGGTFDGLIVHQKARPGSKFGSTITLKNVCWKSSPISISPTPDWGTYMGNDNDHDQTVRGGNGQQDFDSSATDELVNGNIICKVCKEIEDKENAELDYDDDDSSSESNDTSQNERMSNSTNGNAIMILPNSFQVPPTTAQNAIMDQGTESDDDEGVESGTDEMSSRLNSMRISGAYQLGGSKAGSGHYGLAMIININCITDSDPPKPRTGSHKDVKALEKLFRELRIDIFQGGTIHNPTLENPPVFKNTLEEFKSALLAKDYRSCFFVYMGHGQLNYVKLADAKRVNVYKDIIWAFSEEKFPEFRNRPKIFIFGTCQNVPDGPKGFTVGNTSPMGNMLWVTPCPPGQLSPRDNRIGTYFIQTLVKCLRMYKKEELTEILKKVQHEMERNPIEDRGYFILDFRPRLFAQFFFPVGE